MMKHSNPVSIGWQHVVLALAVIAAGLAEPAYCQPDGTPILLQQTPADGGTITPEIGVHHFVLNTMVALAAVPARGYQFVYWLGDVSEPRAPNTVVYLDTPKIIIAVFERAEYGLLSGAEDLYWTPIGGLRRSAPDYSRRAGGGIGRKPRRRRQPSFPPQEEPEPEPEDFPVPEGEEDFPVPEEEQDFPVPEVPEPATIVLLALASLLAFTRRR